MTSPTHDETNPPAGPAQTPMHDRLVGQVLGDCLIEEVIGRGSVGEVYRARQIGLDRAVAVKVIRPEYCADPSGIDRFKREARAVSQFRSSQVVQTYHVGEDKGVHFLVMELMSQGSIEDYAEQQKDSRLDPDEAMRMLRECCVGMLEAERLGIQHRDLKPENLLLDLDRGIKIADFGLSRILGDNVRLTADHSLVGTPMFMSPEQCRFDEGDSRSDMYSLGASFYTLLTGVMPFELTTIEQVFKAKVTVKQLSPQNIVPDLPRKISRIIERMTALEPDHRYQSFRDLIDDIDQNVLETAVGRSGQYARAPASRRMAFSMYALLVAVFAGLCVMVMDLRETQEQTQRQAQQVERRLAEQARSGPEQGPGSSADPAATDPQTPVPAAPIGESAPRTLEYAQALRRVREAFVSGTELDEIDQRLADLRVQVLDEIEPEAGETDPALVAIEALIADVAAARAQREATDLNSPSLEFPFTGLAELTSAAYGPKSEAEESSEAFEAWCEAEGVRLRALFKDRVLRALRAQWQADSVWTVTDTATLDELGKRRERLLLIQQGVRNAVVAFPSESTTIETIVPPAQVAAAMKELRRRTTHIELEGRMRALAARVAVWDSWQRFERTRITVETELEQLRHGFEAIDVQDLSGIESARTVETALERWTEVESALRRAATQLSTRRSAEARSTIAALATTAHESEIVIEETTAWNEALDALSEAFDHLRVRADVEAARESFVRARLQLARVPDAERARRYPDQCITLCDSLRIKSVGMVAFGATRVQTVRDREPVEVGAFFMDRHEVTRGEYIRFLTDLGAVTDRDLADVRQKHPHLELDADALVAARRRLDALQAEGASDALPMAMVSHSEASLCALWQGKDLPTLHQWWCAARGGVDAQPRRWPWGNRWSDRPLSTRAGPREIDTAASGPPVDLAGGVAEWLRDPRYRGVFDVIGGSYADADKSSTSIQQDLFSGKRARAVPRESRLDDVGFRRVLSIAEVLKDIAPIDEPK